MPSRRSPRSTIRMMSWTRDMRSATRDSSRMIASSELRLMSTEVITSSTRDSGGLRSSRIGASMPLSRRRRMFSKRDSPMPTTPPRSMARATCGMPQVPLVTPNTSMPDFRQRSTTVRALRSIFWRSMVTFGPGIGCTAKASRRSAAASALVEQSFGDRSPACGRPRDRRRTCRSRSSSSSRHGRGRRSDRSCRSARVRGSAPSSASSAAAPPSTPPGRSRRRRGNSSLAVASSCVKSRGRWLRS